MQQTKPYLAEEVLRGVRAERVGRELFPRVGARFVGQESQSIRLNRLCDQVKL